MKTAMILAAAALLAATGAPAQTAAPVTKPKAATSAPPAKPAARMATHTTPKGKTITYDCSKKGNLNKKACKG